MATHVDHIYGVDFSGARDAGRKIWIACATPQGDQLALEWCVQAKDLPGGSVSRDEAIAALRTFIVEQRDALFGLDFPFSLPESLIKGGNWLYFAVSFADTYPTDEAFRERCRKDSNGRELRRDCDRVANTPMAAYNLRLYRQTYYGLRDVISPLVTHETAAVLPFMPARPSVPTVIEICPASTLKKEGWYWSYKGTTEIHWLHRFQILCELETRGLYIAAPDLHRALLSDTEGDALDSVIAAYSAWQAYKGGALSEPASLRERLEGRVYA